MYVAPKTPTTVASSGSRLVGARIRPALPKLDFDAPVLRHRPAPASNRSPKFSAAEATPSRKQAVADRAADRAADAREKDASSPSDVADPSNAAASKDKSKRTGAAKSKKDAADRSSEEGDATSTESTDSSTPSADVLALAQAILSEQPTDESPEPTTEQKADADNASSGDSALQGLLLGVGLADQADATANAEAAGGSEESAATAVVSATTNATTAEARVTKPLATKADAAPNDAETADTKTSPEATTNAAKPAPTESANTAADVVAAAQKGVEGESKAKPKATFDDALSRVVAPDAPKSNAAEVVKTVSQPQAAPEQTFADDNVDNVVQSVKTQALQGGGQMRMRLDPPELGALEVAVKMVDGKITASFTTTNDNATQLLSQNLSHLKTSLEASGMTVERIQVKQGPSDSNAQNSNSQSDSRGDARSGAYDPHSRQGDQQRKEAVAKMWRKLAYGTDEVDLVA